ncbi:YicC family protein [Entomospira culicis]|nr:DUF1732 domain-containing protein [Entomospira culicis]
MTGFGRATHEDSDVQLWVEVKSYNAKNLDLYVQLPNELSSYEIVARQMLSERFSRGKIELRAGVTTRLQSLTLQPQVASTLKTLASELAGVGVHLQVGLRELQQMGLLMSVDSACFEQTFLRSVEEAIAAMQRFRQEEGKKHREALAQDCASIEEALRILTDRQEFAMQQVRDRFMQVMEQYQLTAVLNEQRFMEEVAYYLVKNSIKEEIIRLSSHVQALRELLDLDEPIGRRIDFLAQEIQREANTIASKSEEIAIKQASLTIKEVVDSIREQGRNIE